MSEDVVPIRPGITPEFDAEREMIDWAADKIRQFCKTGGAPISIAMVVAGRSTTQASSWSPVGGGPTRGQVCGQAAAALLKRAMPEDAG